MSRSGDFLGDNDRRQQIRTITLPHVYARRIYSYAFHPSEHSYDNSYVKFTPIVKVLLVHDPSPILWLPILVSATSIIRTSFIRTLDYPDSLETRKCITMHAQKAWPVIFCGCGHILWTLQNWLEQNWLTRLLFWTLLVMIMLYRYIYRLGIIKNVGTSVIRTFYLSGMAVPSLWTKWSR